MRWLGVALVAACFLPLVWLPASWLFPLDGEAAATWAHVRRTVLADYALNTLALALGVAAVAGVLGVGCAWAVSCYRFPGRRFFTWGLALPLAIPAYITAYAYGSLTDPASPLGLSLPSVRNLGGAVLLMGLACMPYVYLLARTAFATQPAAWREAAASMGCSDTAYFARVALPAARPFWAMGMTLAIMEAVADIGTVHILGVPTLTEGVYRSWFLLDEPVVAARLAFLLLAGVLLVILLERFERAQARFAHFTRGEKTALRLKGAKGWAVALLCFLPLLLGFIVPLAYVAWLNHYRTAAVEWGRLLGFLGDSLSIAFCVAAVAVAVATFLHFSERMHAGGHALAHLLAYAGYAIPGVAVAVSLMLTSHYMQEASAGRVMITGTFWGVCLACVIRFLATAMGSMHSGYARIPRELDMAAASLGAGAVGIFTRVHAGLLKKPLAVALLVVMVDTLKELPATLILRPFDIKTLAIVTYEYASDDRPVEAAPFALCLIALTAGCMLLIHKLQGRMVKRHV